MIAGAALSMLLVLRVLCFRDLRIALLSSVTADSLSAGSVRNRESRIL
jgi:hypothetical protein